MMMQVYPCCSCNRRMSWRSGGCCNQMLVRNRETSWRKKGRNERKLEKASREIANKKKKKKEKKKKENRKKKKFSLRPSSWLLSCMSG